MTEVEWPQSDAPECPVAHSAEALHGPRMRQDPKVLYREMRRAHGPVAPILLDGDMPAWLVLGYREVHQVSSDPELFGKNSRRWNQWDRIPPDWPLWPWIGVEPSVLVTEGAEHERRAGAVSDALSALDQFELWDRCERIADELIDSFAGSGRADLMADYADRIPLLAVTQACGMPEPQSRQLASDLATVIDGAAAAMTAYERLAAAARDLRRAKLERPGPDLASRLLAHPAGLTESEFVQDLLVVLTAGQQPTANWIGNTLRLMLTDDRFALTLSGGRRSVSDALNEVLWEDTPSTNVIGRWAVRDTRLGGRSIKAGDLLVLGLSAANTDPQVWPERDSARTAGNHAHLAYGYGEHGCPFPAPEIAEVIAKSTIEVLLDRLPDMLLAVDPGTLVWRESAWIRGLEALPVRFTPTYARSMR